MATIPLLDSDKLNPDSREAINAKFAAQDAALAAKLDKSGGTMTGAVAMGGNKITGLGTPTASGDAATKAIVDAVQANLDTEATTRATADSTEAAARTAADSALDAAMVKLTGAQTVAGVKTFSSPVTCEAATPGVALNFPGGGNAGKVSASTYDVRNYVAVAVKESAGLVDAIIVQSADLSDTTQKGRVTFDRDAYVGESKLADEAYVDARVRSGQSMLSGQTASLGSGVQGYTQVNGVDQVFAIPSGSRIVKLSVRTSANANAVDLACSVSTTACKISITPGGGSNGTVAITDAAGTVLFSGSGAKGTGIFIATIVVT